jgi:hypothetical protein
MEERTLSGLRNAGVGSLTSRETQIAGQGITVGEKLGGSAKVKLWGSGKKCRRE